LMALMSVMVSAVSAQVARGGWEAYTTEDEFTGKKNHYMRYFDDRERWTASFFPGPNKLGVLEWYDGVLFMDETLGSERGEAFRSTDVKARFRQRDDLKAKAGLFVKAFKKALEKQKDDDDF